MNRAAAAAMIVFIVLFRIDRRPCPGPGTWHARSRMGRFHDPVRKALPAAPDPSRSLNPSRSPGRYIKHAYQQETTAQQIGIAEAGDRRGGQVPPTAGGQQGWRATAEDRTS